MTSLKDGRAALVAALRDVYGITQVHSCLPDVPIAGAAWVQWVNARPGTECTLEIEWEVFVLLPAADVRTSTDAGDVLVPGLFAALAEVADVEELEPVNVAVNQSADIAMPAVRVTLTTMH